jgi:hypothetical protein
VGVMQQCNLLNAYRDIILIISTSVGVISFLKNIILLASRPRARQSRTDRALAVANAYSILRSAHSRRPIATLALWMDLLVLLEIGFVSDSDQIVTVAILSIVRTNRSRFNTALWGAVRLRRIHHRT